MVMNRNISDSIIAKRRIGWIIDGKRRHVYSSREMGRRHGPQPPTWESKQYLCCERLMPQLRSSFLLLVLRHISKLSSAQLVCH